MTSFEARTGSTCRSFIRWSVARSIRDARSSSGETASPSPPCWGRQPLLVKAGSAVEVEALHDMLGERPALQQAVLGLEELRVLRRAGRLQALDVDDLGRFALDLQRCFAAIDRRGQQGHQQADGQAGEHRAEDQPLPFGGDAQQRQELRAKLPSGSSRQSSSS